MSENGGPVVLQEFVDEDGERLTSLPTYPCDDFDSSGNRYMLWSDIQQTFPGIDYLEVVRGRSRALYMVDQEFQLYVHLALRGCEGLQFNFHI